MFGLYADVYEHLSDGLQRVDLWLVREHLHMGWLGLRCLCQWIGRRPREWRCPFVHLSDGLQRVDLRVMCEHLHMGRHHLFGLPQRRHRRWPRKRYCQIVHLPNWLYR